MIERTIDIWDAGHAADAVCVTTNGSIKKNGHGVMGRGVALQAARYWPQLPRLLGAHLKQHGNHVGILNMVHRMPDRENGTPHDIAIVAFPVKHEWSQAADTELIRQSTDELVMLAGALSWKRIVLPRPGCGNGGLRWMEDQVELTLRVRLDDRFLIVTKP